MAFTRKKIDLTFRLGTGEFGESGFNTVKVSGLRTHVTIQNASPPSMGQASVAVFGLPLSIMNQLSTVTRLNSGQITVKFNQIMIEAGDDESGMSTIFQGQMTIAQIDLNSSPDSMMHIVAHAGLFEAVKSTAAVSYPGSADAAVIMGNLAVQNGYAFENSGVSVILATPYFSGSPRMQMAECAEAADINWVLDSGTLAIWPKGKSRGGAVPLISSESGMIGYPSNYERGVEIRTTFNPQLRIGGSCRVQSQLPFANGSFVVFDIGHELESETPNGQWETSFHGSSLNG